MQQGYLLNAETDNRFVGLFFTLLGLLAFYFSLSETLQLASSWMSRPFQYLIWIAILWSLFTILISIGMWLLISPSIRSHKLTSSPP